MLMLIALVVILGSVWGGYEMGYNDGTEDGMSLDGAIKATTFEFVFRDAEKQTINHIAWQLLCESPRFKAFCEENEIDFYTIQEEPALTGEELAEVLIYLIEDRKEDTNHE